MPPIVEQVNNLVQNLPGYAQDIQEFVSENDRLRQLEEDYNITSELAEAGREAARPGRRRRRACSPTSGSGSSTRSSPAVTILVLSLFMIGSGRRWLDLARAATRATASARNGCNRLFDRIGNAVGNYVAGALLQAHVAGCSRYIVLTILGVPYALPLAVMVFVLDLMPLVGATLGAIIVGDHHAVPATSRPTRSSGSSGRSSTSRSRTT